MTSLLTFGFLLGIRHAMEADHIATVASLASTNASRRQMLRQGIAWGVGHSLTLLLFGGVVLWMDMLVPEQLASGLEMAVGAMMVLLGIDVLRRASKIQIPVINANDRDRKAVDDSQVFPLRALLMGLLHGSAGSAALILLFVDRIDSLISGLSYILLFSLGSIAGMVVFSLAISIPLLATAEKMRHVHRTLQLTIGCCTGGVGLFLIGETLVI